MPLFRRRNRTTTPGGTQLPDPALPPARRGDWDSAAVTNVEITELVKRQIKTVTRPWNK